MQLWVAAAGTKNIVDSIKFDIKAAAAKDSAKFESARVESQASRAEIFGRLERIDFKFDRMSESLSEERAGQLVRQEKIDQTLDKISYNMTEQMAQIQTLAKAVASLETNMKKQEEQQAGLVTQLIAIYGSMQVP